MIRTLIALITLVFLAAPAVAQTTGSVQIWNNLDMSTVQPQVQILTSTPITEKVGIQTWTLTSKGWSEALVGLSFSPEKWVSVVPSLGLETDADPLRAGLDIWLGGSGYSLLFLQEYGGSGYWYRVVATHQFNQKTRVGVNGSRFFGWGPYVERQVGPAALWVTVPIIGIGENQLAFGMKVGFK